jgi:CubicO group peptidase (beta-lactamase class C family)
MMKFSFISGVLIMLIIVGCEEKPPNQFEKGSISESAYQHISKFKKEFKIRGLAFALFNEKETITKFCLGESTYGFAIDEETLFSIQSISKNFTALAALIAAEDSLIDMDKPISEYLQDFTVNNCFTNRPEDLITIRLMLTHRAGFTHEAPVGNNFDHRKVDIQDHLESISHTWLKFPPDSNYFYSNLGYDLTTKIIAQESGMDFNDYLKNKICLPMGMKNTTVDDDEVLAYENRTEGNIAFLVPNHISIPLIGSGAIYTNINDLVKYTQMHMNRGWSNDRKIVSEVSLDKMYKIESHHYGLGAHIDKSHGNYYINHNGGGYGYTSTMVFYPEFNVGAVLLCNGESPTFNVCQKIITEYIQKRGLKKDLEASNRMEKLNADYFQNQWKYDEVKGQLCAGEEEYQPEWELYEGTYSLMVPGYHLAWYTKLAVALGYRPVKWKVYKKDNKLVFSDWNGEKTLREYQNGFFFTAEGEVLDLTKEPPTYRNILLEKL